MNPKLKKLTNERKIDLIDLCKASLWFKKQSLTINWAIKIDTFEQFVHFDLKECNKRAKIHLRLPWNRNQHQFVLIIWSSSSKGILCLLILSKSLWKLSYWQFEGKALPFNSIFILKWPRQCFWTKVY